MESDDVCTEIGSVSSITPVGVSSIVSRLLCSSFFNARILGWQDGSLAALTCFSKNASILNEIAGQRNFQKFPTIFVFAGSVSGYLYYFLFTFGQILMKVDPENELLQIF